MGNSEKVQAFVLYGSAWFRRMEYYSIGLERLGFVCSCRRRKNTCVGSYCLVCLSSSTLDSIRCHECRRFFLRQIERRREEDRRRREEELKRREEYLERKEEEAKRLLDLQEKARREERERIINSLLEKGVDEEIVQSACSSSNEH